MIALKAVVLRGDQAVRQLLEEGGGAEAVAECASRPAAAAGVSIAQHGGAGGSPARLPSENTGYSNAVKISHNSKVPQGVH